MRYRLFIFVMASIRPVLGDSLFNHSLPLRPSRSISPFGALIWHQEDLCYRLSILLITSSPSGLSSRRPEELYGLLKRPRQAIISVGECAHHIDLFPPRLAEASNKVIVIMAPGWYVLLLARHPLISLDVYIPSQKFRKRALLSGPHWLISHLAR